MRKQSGQTGQSVVVGAMLLLGLLVIFLSWYQVTQVPVQNQNAEAEFHDNVRLNMLELREKGYNSINNDEINQVKINNKVNYPSWRLAGLQDNIGSLVIEDLGTSSVTISNESPTVTSLPTNVSSIEYRTSYDERRESSFVFEYGSIFELNSNNNNSIQGSQQFIRDNNIYLFSFSSDFRAIQSENPSFVIVPNQSVQKTTITGDTDTNGDKLDIVLEFKTQVGFDLWESMLLNEEHIINMYKSGDYVVVVLDGTETYDVYTGSANIEL